MLHDRIRFGHFIVEIARQSQREISALEPHGFYLLFGFNIYIDVTFRLIEHFLSVHGAFLALNELNFFSGLSINRFVLVLLLFLQLLKDFDLFLGRSLDSGPFLVNIDFSLIIYFVLFGFVEDIDVFLVIGFHARLEHRLLIVYRVDFLFHFWDVFALHENLLTVVDSDGFFVRVLDEHFAQNRVHAGNCVLIQFDFHILP